MCVDGSDGSIDRRSPRWAGASYSTKLGSTFRRPVRKALSSALSVAVFAITSAAPVCAQAADSLTHPERILEVIQEAVAKDAAGQSTEAVRLWTRAVAMNPFLSLPRYRLAQASLRVGDTTAAIAALARYVDLGGGDPALSTAFGPDSPGGAAYQLARLFALRGDSTRALQYLRRALGSGYRARLSISIDSAFTKLRANQDFLRLAPAVNPTVTRAESWRRDIAFLHDELLRLQPSSSRGLRTEELADAARRITDSLAFLDDAAIALRLQQLLRAMGAGHTGLLTEGVPAWQGAIPVQFEVLRDSVFVSAAASSYAAAIGGRLIAIDGKPLAVVLPALDSMASRDNAFGLIRNRGRHLRYPKLLHALGIAKDTARVTLTLVTESGQSRTMAVTAAPVSNSYNRVTGDLGWPSALNKESLYLRDRTTPWWYSYDPTNRLVYFGFNSVVESQAESFQSFTQRLFAFIDTAAVDRLIIDLRWNNGGNSRLLPPLITGLIRSKINAPNRLFVITSPTTYSAAMNAATFIDRNTFATFVGEPTPSQPNFVGESNIIVLPYTGTPVSISDVFWQSSWPTDRRISLVPTIYAPLTFRDLITGHDPALAAILALLAPRVFP